MKRLLTATLLLVLISLPSFGINPFWVWLDKRLIKKVEQLDKSKPRVVEQLFLKKGYSQEKQELGFGWRMASYQAYGGYTSIRAHFYFYQDSLVSFVLLPGMPDEKPLISKYRYWYGRVFTVDSDTVLPYLYNCEGLSRPLQEYEGQLTGKTIPLPVLNYMSPESGTHYGYYSSHLGVWPNRKAFLEIKDQLTPELVTLLLYSLNPASRLTALEYYFKHKQQFTDQSKLEQWIERILLETPNTSIDSELQSLPMVPAILKEMVSMYGSIKEK